jgi:acyl-CoA synthetase (NDP forming)
MWKAGTTDAGIKAAASHTANMTGSYDLYRAALRQSGIIEVDDVEPIVDAAKLFGQGRLPKGNAVGVLSISGGSGVVFADAAVRGGLTLPPFAPQTLARLRKMIPAFGSAENPADITAALFNDTTLFTRTLDVVLEDPGLDQLVVLIASISGRNAALSAEIVAAAAAKTDKPVSVQWSGRQAKSEDAVKAFAAAGVPFVTTPVRLARAAAILSRFAEDQRRLLPRKVPSIAVAKSVTLPAGAVTLNEAESKVVLRGYGVPVAKEVFVASGSDVEAASRQLKGPFAVKVVSRDVPHKTEAGGVKLGVTQEALGAAAKQVTDNAKKHVPGANIDGVLVSEMAAGLETLIGVINDPSFGPVVALGLGGVFTEVLKDVTYRVAPFGIETARDMIADLRAAKLFEGYRGKPAADKEALANALVAVSSMAVALAPRLKELDINPVFVGPAGEGVVAADALIVLA